MKNIYLPKWKDKDSEHFTTEMGIKFRRLIFPLSRFLIKMTYVFDHKKIVVDGYPKLEKDEPYIFVAGHSFPGEIGSNLSAVDRSTYVVIGTTDHVLYDPQMYFAWLNGLIYVDKFDPKSRKDCQKKMLKVLKKGSSVILYPEGILNNSENSLCGDIYSGFYHVAKAANVKVVPILSANPYKTDTIHIKASEPIDVSDLTKEEAIRVVTDELATLKWEEDIMNSEPLMRKKLSGDIHEQYNAERFEVYEPDKWHDAMSIPNQELLPKPNDNTPDKVWEFTDCIELTRDNAYILNPIIEQRTEDKNNSFQEYAYRAAQELTRTRKKK